MVWGRGPAATPHPQSMGISIPDSHRSRSRSRLRIWTGRSLFAALAALLLVPSACALQRNGHPVTDRSGVLIVVANKLALSDVQNNDRLSELLSRYSLGLVSPSAYGQRTPDSVMASASAGMRARSGRSFGQVYNWDEAYQGDPAALVYNRRTGFGQPRRGLLHLGIATVWNANRAVSGSPDIWALGQALQDKSVVRAAYGNADYGETASRSGASLVADKSGFVSAGNVSATSNRANPELPGGVETDLDGILPDIVQRLETGGVVSVHYGDLERIERERSMFARAAYLHVRQQAVNRLADWLGRVHSASPESSVLLLSLVPPYGHTGRWDTMGMAAVFAAGYEGGVLTSNTTRTRGVVAAIDVAPTVLALRGLSSPRGITGYRVHDVPDSTPITTLSRWNMTTLLNGQLQFPLLLGLGLLAGASGVTAVGYLTRRQSKRLHALPAIVGLALVAWIPFILLVPLDQPEWLAIVPFGLLLSFLLPSRLPGENRYLPLEAPALVLLGAIVLSLFGLMDWLQRSAFTAWQLPGLRYYGIGNEYLGCVIGTAAAIPLWRYGKRPGGKIPLQAIAVWFAFWVLMVGLPMLGANSGGAIAATATFVLVLRALMGRKILPLNALIAAAAGIAAAICFAVLDAMVSGASPTHLGQAARAIGAGNWQALLGLIERKLSLNLSLWSRLGARIYLVGVGFLLLIWVVYRDRMLQHVKLPPKVLQGILAIGYGGLAALVFNDSGVVTFGLILISILLWMLWDAVLNRAGGLPVVQVGHARSRR